VATRIDSSTSVSSTAEGAIRSFHFHASDDALADLRRRVAATNWPERELVADASQGVQLDTMRKLADCWQTEHDWRTVEARLNALPQFVTTIDGLDIHFIHVKSRHENALPVIVTHGWPGSIIEQLKIIEPLTDPTAVSVFPDEIYSAPRSWAEKAYPNLIHYNRLPKGGHFAAWEQPDFLTEELRAGFRSLR